VISVLLMAGVVTIFVVTIEIEIGLFRAIFLRKPNKSN